MMIDLEYKLKANYINNQQMYWGKSVHNLKFKKQDLAGKQILGENLKQYISKNILEDQHCHLICIPR